MSTWVTREGRKAYEASLTLLSKLHILPVSSVKLSLNSTFKTSLRHAITGSGTSGSFGVPADQDGKHPPPSVEELDAYTLERWETILHYMVSSRSGRYPARPSQGVLLLLQ
ncbi:transcription factor Tfb2 [Panus rudis PR-1116 ss-1]|nr:transcription factor Tfb2 [Panus rudis PR-1116 ss-1]